MLQPNTAGESARKLEGAAAGERVTSTELDQLTRAFADRYVGLLYSVCGALKEDNADPEQRRAAQVLLTDCATNVYDIASNADAFTRLLDLIVVTTLVSQVWGDDGRAKEVFGEQGRMLADALSKARAESRVLAARVLTTDQLEVLDSLLRDWREKNPEVVRVSFARFSNFAIGRGRSAAAEVLEARGFFSEVGEAGQAVDEARLLGERMFYWLKRAPTLLQWHVDTVKDDWVASPKVDTALTDLHRLTDQVERLPERVAAERQAILSSLDDRLQRADGTIAEIQATLDQANTLVDSVKPASDSLNEMLRTGDSLLARYAALRPSKVGTPGRPFDIREYEQTAKELTHAAEKMNELLATTEQLLVSSELRDQSQGVMNALFWRLCALLGVLFALLILYRSISHLLMRNRGG